MIDQQELLKLIKELIGIKSPYYEEEKVINYVNNWFHNKGIKSLIHEYHEHKVTNYKGKNVVLTLEGNNPGPTIYINGHLDTVNLSSGWTVDPYKGHINGDKIYGLGVLDMKSGCAAAMIALNAFIKNHKGFKGKVIATFVSMEEGPYGMGTNALIEENYLDDVDFSIVTEPSAGFADTPFPTICLGARGGYGLDVEFFGKSAHAALPQKGKNAAVDAAKFILELENINYITDEHLGTGKACVIALESDGGPCSIPDYAKAKLFWHIVTGENEGTIITEIEKAIERANIQCSHKINFRKSPSKGSKGFLPYTVDGNNLFVRSFIKTVEKVCDSKPTLAYFQSIGDFNYLGSRLNAPVVIFGPDGGNFHSYDEYALITSIVKTAETIYEFLTNILTKS